MTAPSTPAPLTILKPQDRDTHDECEKMHALGYCICTTVACVWCDKMHPPHKSCGSAK